MISVIVADPEPAFVDTARALVMNAPAVSDVVLVGGISEAQSVAAQSPSIILIGPNIEFSDAVTFVQKQTIARPETAIILARFSVDADVLRDALRAGARDVVTVPLDRGELMAAVERARGFSQKLGQVTAEAGREGQEAKRAYIITVFSAKGGVGKTFIATNTALVIAQERPGSVILTDLDLQFGDVGMMLKMIPERTIHDVVQSIDRLDTELMRGFLTSYERGLEVLLAPVHPDHAEDINQEHLRAVITTLRGMGDLVVIDTAASFGNSSLLAMDFADEIYVVATLDAPCIKDTKLALETMQRLGYPEDKIKVVLNRSDSRVGLSVRDVESALELRVTASIPSDRLVPLTVNKGIPIVLDAPRSPVARSLVLLARDMKEKIAEVKAAA